MTAPQSLSRRRGIDERLERVKLAGMKALPRCSQSLTLMVFRFERSPLRTTLAADVSLNSRCRVNTGIPLAGLARSSEVVLVWDGYRIAEMEYRHRGRAGTVLSMSAHVRAFALALAYSLSLTAIPVPGYELSRAPWRSRGRRGVQSAALRRCRGASRQGFVASFSSHAGRPSPNPTAGFRTA